MNSYRIVAKPSILADCHRLDVRYLYRKLRHQYGLSAYDARQVITDAVISAQAVIPKAWQVAA